MAKEKLTDPKLRKVRPPESGRIEIWDTQVPGLGFRVTAKGVKSWTIRYRVGTRHRRFTLGNYPALSLADARDQALIAIRDTRLGKDIQREKEITRTESAPKTLSEAFADFVKGYAKKKNRSWREVESLFENEIRQKLGKRPLTDITRADLITRFDEIKAPHTANKAYRYMSRFFKWCLEKNRLKESPMTHVVLPHPEVEKSRDRVLTDAEIVELWIVWERLAYPFGVLFKLLLVLGQRR
ncbi:MAG: DUF4102 domain-containing protein, partial [Rhodospirillales bacterium]|nr:DUF4102 domain-containing protein [Rhodospirillales bacterium]